MNKKSANIYIAASLVMLIPTPGRFVYGLALILELNLLMACGSCVKTLAKLLKLEELTDILTLTVLISLTIIYRQIMVLLYTEVAMTLGYILFLPTVSSFLIGYLFNNSEKKLLVRLKKNIISCATFSLNSLVFFIFRDIFGYGTFTFFGKKHQINEVILFDPEKIQALSFFATIPGALILCGIILFIFIFISEKIDIIDKAKKGETN